jgi:hypothetical protein
MYRRLLNYLAELRDRIRCRIYFESALWNGWEASLTSLGWDI